MPKYFQLEVVSGQKRWVERDKPYAQKQFTHVTGDEYYSAVPVYRIAFVGRGSAIAYYLTALAPRTNGDESDTGALHASMAIFGKVDPWSRDVRGDGYINHEDHLVGQWGSKVAKYSEDYLRRDAFVRQNAAAFQRAGELGATLVNDDVFAIYQRGDVYQISTATGPSYYAAFVVVAMGLGPHRGLQSGKGAPKLPDSVKGFDVTLMKRVLAPAVMDLDRFMREYPEQDGIDKDLTKRLTPKRKLTIAVHGANAGIDAVQRAWQLGHDIRWLCPASPIFLDGNRLPIHKEVTDVTRHMLASNSDVTVSPTEGGMVKAEWTDKEGAGTANVDVYVIAVGQDPYAEGAVGDVLFQMGGIKEASLSMIWDFDQVFGLPFQTILGYQLPGPRKGFGLQIIGGSTEILTRALDKIFDVRALVADFEKQITPLEIEPSEEHCNRQIDESKSLTQKWGSEEGRRTYHAQKVENWQRAVAQRDRFLKLAEAYLGGIAGRRGPIMELLTHQVDPKAAPKNLDEILETFGDDRFLVGQVATPERPATSAGASALLPSQLSAVRAVVAALSAFIPEYIVNGDSNFTTDDRTMLAVYIAQNFPGFDEVEANARVSATMSLRRSSRTPLGFHDDDLRRVIQERWARESKKL